MLEPDKTKSHESSSVISNKSPSSSETDPIPAARTSNTIPLLKKPDKISPIATTKLFILLIDLLFNLSII